MPDEMFARTKLEFSLRRARTYTKFELILVELMKYHRILKLSASKMMRVQAAVTQSVAEMPWDFASSLRSRQVRLWSALRQTMRTSMKMRPDLGIHSNDAMSAVLYGFSLLD